MVEDKEFIASLKGRISLVQGEIEAAKEEMARLKKEVSNKEKVIAAMRVTLSQFPGETGAVEPEAAKKKVGKKAEAPKEEAPAEAEGEIEYNPRAKELMDQVEWKGRSRAPRGYPEKIITILKEDGIGRLPIKEWEVELAKYNLNPKSTRPVIDRLVKDGLLKRSKRKGKAHFG